MDKQTNELVRFCIILPREVRNRLKMQAVLREIPIADLIRPKIDELLKELEDQK